MFDPIGGWIPLKVSQSRFLRHINKGSLSEIGSYDQCEVDGEERLIEVERGLFLKKLRPEA